MKLTIQYTRVCYMERAREKEIAFLPVETFLSKSDNSKTKGNGCETWLGFLFFKLYILPETTSCNLCYRAMVNWAHGCKIIRLLERSIRLTLSCKRYTCVIRTWKMIWQPWFSTVEVITYFRAKFENPRKWELRNHINLFIYNLYHQSSIILYS